MSRRKINALIFILGGSLFVAGCRTLPDLEGDSADSDQPELAPADPDPSILAAGPH
jgi:hypothetical protein